MKIYIFGSNGMLGDYIKRRLNGVFELVSITRNDIDLRYINKLTLYDFLKNKKYKHGDIIINCAGLIKQRNNTEYDTLMVNSVFPNLLAEYDNVIHITTDCVFSGSKLFNDVYTESDLHDCLDLYGKSKSIGENNNSTIIRTSIIGHERVNKLSFLEWVLGNEKNINGYMNHYWNGVTCLELSEIIFKIITNNDLWKGVRHIYNTDHYTKYNIIELINDIYQKSLNIIPTESYYCNRLLGTAYDQTFVVSNIKTQIINLFEDFKNNY